MYYIKLISKIKKNKYQNYFNLNKDFYDSYIASRLDTINKLKKKKFNLKKILKPCKTKNFHTFNNLYLLFDKFNKTFFLTKKDLNTIFMF